MRKAMAAAVVALVVGAPMLPHQEVLASDRSAAGYSTKAGMKGWIGLHRPHGEVVRIKTGQIVFVMSAANTGADKRSLSGTTAVPSTLISAWIESLQRLSLWGGKCHEAL
jgi:hypothetical protein